MPPLPWSNHGRRKDAHSLRQERIERNGHHPIQDGPFASCLVLAAIHHRRRCLLQGEAGGLAFGFKGQSHFPGARERLANIPVFRSAVERNQSVAVLAIGLKPVADLLRALAEELRAPRAFDFDFVVDHEISPNRKAGAKEVQSAFEGLSTSARVA